MPFLAAIPAIAASIAGAVGSAAGAAAGAVGSAAGAVGSAAASAAGTAASALGSAGSAIGSAAGSAGSAVGQAAGQVGQAAGNVAGQVGHAVGNVAGQAGQAVGKVGGQAGQLVGKAATKGIQQALPSFGRGELLQGLSKADLAAMASKGITLTGKGGNLGPSTLGKIAQTPTAGGQALGLGKKALKMGAQMMQSGGEEREQRQAQMPQQQMDPLALMAQLIAAGQLPQYQEGGQAPAGQPAIVGEAGPEVAVGGPQGLTVAPVRSRPYTAAQAPEEGMGSKIMDRAMSGIVGALNPAALQQVRAANAERMKYLTTIGVQNPELLRSSPSLVQAVDRTLGAGTSQELVSKTDPNFQAKMLAQAYGVPLLPNGNEFQQLTDVMAERGWGVTTTSKGEIRFNKQARPTSEQDKLQAFRDYQTLFDRLVASGQDEVSAAQNAAKRVQQVGAARGYVVPQSLEDLAMAGPETALAAAQAASKEFAQQQVQLQFAGPKAAAAEAATRRARINQPITQDEIRVGHQLAAAQVGGVTFGRTMSDEDLVSADEQGLALKQQPDGSYIGIPQDRLLADSAVMYPRELLTKRTAQKIAAKRTTQHENAQIVLERLDEIDTRGALLMLQPATPQAPGLIPGLVGALKTEVAGQTAGRITLFNARRSTDPEMRDRAVALLSLKTLTTSVVKALGDVGAISEADKAVISDRFNRIANGVASQEEAASELQLLRTMMMHVTAGPENIRLNSPEAAAMKATIHKIRTGQIPPGSPPEGFRTLPGTNVLIRIEP